MAKRGRTPATTRRIERLVFADGSFQEGTITQFPPTPQRPAGVDYRLAYVATDSTVLVLYDNQGGHSPHRHVRGKRELYEFVDVDRLLSDFLADVASVRSGEQ
jgi:hypothetical protein